MRAAAMQPCVLGVYSPGSPPKYWTGELSAGWPVYLRDRSKAKQMPRREAERCAAEFNARMQNVSWEPEPIEPA
jgi:hypothetical protein